MRNILAPLCLVVTLLLFYLPTAIANAQPLPLPRITVAMDGAQGPEDLAVGLQVVLLLTVLSIGPAILIMTTSFARIVVVLSLLRQALGAQQLPPNQVIMGLALFLTFFVMTPVWQRIHSQALQPYLAREIPQEESFRRALEPLRGFMLKQTRERDLALFLGIAQGEQPHSREDVPTLVLIPSFIISELKTAFQIGFLLYIPFLVLDMVVASGLISMGMLMLPPVIISLPLKLMLFVLVDGWYLVVGSLVRSFQ
ncbi:MAG: flagellar type III secretion system pore protein FliP [Nitrospinae bacterium]|nr:flagellar type III secretion system pore protein FliP [Nitrospinota bacterium]